jgi:hypothetical protein
LQHPYLSLAVLALGLAVTAPSAAGQEAAASWQRHEIDFAYMGFTTRYSCEGLREKMRLLLEASGARPDYEVRLGPCSTSPGRVTEFPRVRLVFHAAQAPVPGSHDAGEAVVARWRPVTFARHQPRRLEAGDCELVEQFRDRVLPAFTTRHLESDVNCIPHQLSGSSFLLTFEVLEGLPSADPPKR